MVENSNEMLRLVCQECGLRTDHILSAHILDYPKHVARFFICKICNSVTVESQMKSEGGILNHLPKKYYPNLREDYKKEAFLSPLHIPDEPFELYKKCLVSYNDGLDEACFIYLIKLVNSIFDFLIDQKFESSPELRVKTKKRPLVSKIRRTSININGKEGEAERTLKTILIYLVNEYQKRNLLYDSPGRDTLSKGVVAIERAIQKVFIIPGYNKAVNNDIVEVFDNYLFESGSIQWFVKI